jgi:hypothetical protein
MGKPGFLFLGGCARSGTSALWMVLTADPSVVLGLERYVDLAHNKPERFTPELFERDRFLDIRKGDTFYDSFAFFPFQQYQDAVARFDTAQLRGDKIPMLYPLYGQLARAFPEPKILYILRNPFDVAASFERRAMDIEDQLWEAARGYRAACDEWNASVQATQAWSKRLSFYVIDYESFFSGQADIASLAAFLALEPDHLGLGYRRQLARQERPDHADALTRLARQYISRCADFEAYRELLKLADRSRFPGSPPARPTPLGGRKYADEDRGILDYDYYEAVPGRWFRGPAPSPSPGPSIAFLGAVSTFGRLAQEPYPSIVAAKLGVQAVNLGYGGVRAPFYYTDHRLLTLINRCDCAVIEVSSVRGTATPVIEPRDHQSAFIRLRGAKSDFEFADHLFAELRDTWTQDDLDHLVDEIRQSYLDEIAELLARIKIPKVLMWFSQRPPATQIGFENVDEFIGGFPHFVTATMVEALREKADGLVEVVSRARFPNRLTDPRDGRPVPVFRRESKPDMSFSYPSPLMHQVAADALMEPIGAILASRTPAQASAP